MTAADPRDGLHGLVARWRDPESPPLNQDQLRQAIRNGARLDCADDLEQALAHARPEAVDSLAADQQNGGGDTVRSDGATQCADCGGWNLPDCPPCCDTPQPSIPAPAQQDEGFDRVGDAATSLRLLAATIRKCGTCAPAALELVAARLEALVTAQQPVDDPEGSLRWLDRRIADMGDHDRTTETYQHYVNLRAMIRAQQPAVVGDGVHSLPAEWRATAARHRSRGTGQSVAQANGYDMAANMLEAAITPAATPGDYLHPGARVEWQDQVGRWWPVTITRHRPESYDAELDDGCDALDYPRGRFRRIAAQKEGNGNG